MQFFLDLNLPAPPPESTMLQNRKDELHKVLINSLLDAMAGFAGKVIEDVVPFGSLAVAFVSDIAERVHAIKKNQQAALRLSKNAAFVLKQAKTIIDYFDKIKDEDGKKEAQALLELTFLAMRLVAEMSKKPGGPVGTAKKRVIMYVGCKRSKEAMERLANEMNDAKSNVALVLSAANVRTRVPSMSKSRSQDQEQYLRHLRDRPAADDAIKFWQKGGWQKEAPLTELLVELTIWAKDQGVIDLPQENLNDNDHLYEFFGGKRNKETVHIRQFALFLEKFASVLEALCFRVGCTIPETPSDDTNLASAADVTLDFTADIAVLVNLDGNPQLGDIKENHSENGGGDNDDQIAITNSGSSSTDVEFDLSRSCFATLARSASSAVGTNKLVNSVRFDSTVGQGSNSANNTLLRPRTTTTSAVKFNSNNSNNNNNTNTKSGSALSRSNLRRSLPSEQGSSSWEPLFALRQVLNPVSAGADLVKHFAVFQPGTREWVFKDVEAWAALPAGAPNRRVFWLRGTGGLGKSVIAAQLVARYGTDADDDTNVAEDGGPKSPRKSLFSVDQGQGGLSAAPSDAKLNLAAYLFCKHDDQARNNPRRVIATLAFRFASMLPVMRVLLNKIIGDKTKCAELQSMLSGAKGSLAELFSLLLAEPLQTTLSKMPDQQGDIFVLVDALDELRAGVNRQELLKLMGEDMPRLPERVRFIFTSRPEDDIKAHFTRLKPYVIDKQDEKQLADLQLYAENHIVHETELRNAPDAEVKALLDEVLRKADGVFLALRLVATAVRDKEEELAASGKHLTLQDVFDFLGSFSSLVDGTYAETLQRVRLRLKEAAVGDEEMEKDLLATLRQILAALLAARQPLLGSDLHELCGGLERRGEALTNRMLSALSLLFSSSNNSSPVEPLHKTVVDFLRDKERSKEFHIDEREGHAALAMATFRVLREYNLIPQERDAVVVNDKWKKSSSVLKFNKARVVEPDEIIGLSAVRYVLRHGHVHLGVCGEAVASSSLPLLLLLLRAATMAALMFA